MLFSNLAAANATDIDIILLHNQIDRIEQNVFDGIAASIKMLDLSNNNLTHIPNEITKLTALESFYIEDNPIATLDAGVMTILGNTLTDRFSLSLSKFASFPVEMHYLSELESLIMSDIQFSTIDSHAFDNLNNSLKYLVFYHSNLRTFPHALCSLTNLKLLRFENSQFLYKKTSDDLNACFGNLSILDTLFLFHNNLTVFPSIIKLFPSLRSLYLSDNNIQIIDNKDVRENFSLIELQLSNNSFLSIPVAINRFAKLETLDLSVNLISSIDDLDLHNLHQLQTLKLDHNPISRISHNAFAAQS